MNEYRKKKRQQKQRWKYWMLLLTTNWVQKKQFWRFHMCLKLLLQLSAEQQKRRKRNEYNNRVIEQD